MLCTYLTRDLKWNRKCYSALSTAMRPIVHCNDYCCIGLWSQISPESLVKCLSRMKVPDLGRNLVTDNGTADGEGALRELSPCPHDKSCVGYNVEEWGTYSYASSWAERGINDYRWQWTLTWRSECLHPWVRPADVGRSEDGRRLHAPASSRTPPELPPASTMRHHRLLCLSENFTHFLYALSLIIPSNRFW